MKTKSFFILPILVLLLCSFGKNKTGNKHDNNMNAPRILFIGFEKNQFNSNYYGIDFLADKFGISADSIHDVFNKSIYRKLSSYNGIEFNELKDEHAKNYFYQHVTYSKGVNNINEVTPSNLDKEIFNKMLEQNRSDYLLFISQYQINWSGEPFNTLIHLLDYSLFDKKMNKLYSGQLFFDSEEIESFMTTKKAEKKTYQLAQKIEKLIK